MIPSTAFSRFHSAATQRVVQQNGQVIPKKNAPFKRRIRPELNVPLPRSIHTMPVTLITDVIKDDGTWMTAALRIKEEPGHLLEFYAYHLGIDFEKPEQRTPEWEEEHVRSLIYVLNIRQINDVEKYPHAYGNTGPGHRPLPVTRRAIIQLYGDMDVTIRTIVSREERWDLAAQVLIRRATFFGSLDNPAAYENKALEQVLDGLFREDSGTRPPALSHDLRDDIVEGEVTVCGTFGGGLSGKFETGKEDGGIEEDHLDKFKPDEEEEFWGRLVFSMGEHNA